MPVLVAQWLYFGDHRRESMEMGKGERRVKAKEGHSSRYTQKCGTGLFLESRACFSVSLYSERWIRYFSWSSVDLVESGGS